MLFQTYAFQDICANVSDILQVPNSAYREGSKSKLSVGDNQRSRSRSRSRQRNTKSNSSRDLPNGQNDIRQQDYFYDISQQTRTQYRNASDDEYIMMVSGLPGKCDFRILKGQLQERAKLVNGRVKFVKNGQGFITFRSEHDAMAAAGLFHGFEIYGKNLTVTFVSSIPFDMGRSQTGTEHDGGKAICQMAFAILS